MIGALPAQYLERAVTAAFALPFPLQSVSRLSIDEFLSFIAERPEKERWQLIDGIAFLMSPPTRIHQTIVANLLRVFDDALDPHRPELIALPEVGLIVPGPPDFRPQADLAVIDSSGPEGSWQDRFYLAAEVLSDSNTNEYIAQKRERYIAHAENQYVLVVEQRQRKIEIFARRNGWRPVVLQDLDDIIDLPEFDVHCSLAQVYRRTPLS
jgi:Uma2 family endonuclease